MSLVKSFIVSTIVSISFWMTLLVVLFRLGNEGAMYNLPICLAYAQVSRHNSFTSWLGILHDGLVSTRFIFSRSTIISSKKILGLEFAPKNTMWEMTLHIFLVKNIMTEGKNIMIDPPYNTKTIDKVEWAYEINRDSSQWKFLIRPYTIWNRKSIMFLAWPPLDSFVQILLVIARSTVYVVFWMQLNEMKLI